VHTIRGYLFGAFAYLLQSVNTASFSDAGERENQWLRHENARLMLENIRNKEARYENERLRSLLSFKGSSRLELLPARVVGRSSGKLRQNLVLDIGSHSGVSRNMAVVTSQGLVGKILSVGSSSSKAILLLDGTFRASALVQRSRVGGIVHCESGRNVILSEVPKRSDVQVGDAVVTSGLSTILPGGLEIGDVVSAEEEDRGMFMRVVVQPAVDFSRLEEVFVVRMYPGPIQTKTE